MSERRLRQGARALVLRPDNRVLLVRFELPHVALWAAPGGGVEADETHEAALRRELTEDVGLEDADRGPCIRGGTTGETVAERSLDGQLERYYLVRTRVFEPRPALSPDELRAEYVVGLRWWTLAAMEASEETFLHVALPLSCGICWRPARRLVRCASNATDRATCARATRPSTHAERRSTHRARHERAGRRYARRRVVVRGGPVLARVKPSPASGS